MDFYLFNKYRVQIFIGCFLILLGAALIFLGYLFFSIAQELIAFLFVGMIMIMVGVSLYLFQNLRKHIEIIERQLLSTQSAIALSRIYLNDPIFLSRHSVAPDFIELIYEIIRRRAVSNILELGSGSSSIYFSAILRDQGKGNLICLENDASWVNLIQSEIDKSLFSSETDVIARVLNVTLKYNPKIKSIFYDLENMRFDPVDYFDLLIVDGPSDVKNRWPALEMLNHLLTPDVTIVLDDGDQDAIRKTVKLWVRENKNLAVRYYPTLKGTWVLWDKEHISDMDLPLP